MPWVFPDAEKVLCDLLAPIAPASTFLADGWEQHLPQIEVHRVGGSCDDVTDTARLQVAVYASSRAHTWALATQVRETILAAGGTVVGPVLIDSTGEYVASQQVPDVDPDDRRVISTYWCAFRRHQL